MVGVTVEPVYDVFIAHASADGVEVVVTVTPGQVGGARARHPVVLVAGRIADTILT